jgi:hypothetical protein
MGEPESPAAARGSPERSAAAMVRSAATQAMSVSRSLAMMAAA